MIRAGLALLLGGAGAGGLVLSAVLTAIAMRAAPRVGYVDHPGGHKSHARPMPYGGGVAVFLTFALPLVAGLLAASAVPQAWFGEHFGGDVAALVGGVRLRIRPAVMVLVCAMVLFVLGLIDDLRPAGPWTKLAVIVAVALAVPVAGRIRLAELLGPVGATVATALWIIVITNAFNFLDNMDGLSGGVAAVCLLVLAACGLLRGQVLVPAMSLLVAGAVLGFLLFNFPPAKVYLGDAGSLVLGFLVSVIAILTTYYESAAGEPAFALAMPLVICAVPLYDFASVVLIRIAEGRNPMRGDQRHFSHRLVERGLSPRLAVLTIYLATATTALSATLLPGADLRQSITVFAIVLMVLAIIAILETPWQNQRTNST